MENLAAISLAVAGILSPIITLILGMVQARNQKERNKSSKKLEDATSSEKLSAAWELVTNTLQEERQELKVELSSFKNEREIMITNIAELNGRVSQLEKQLQEKDEQHDRETQAQQRAWEIKERGYQEAINTLTDKIADQERKSGELETKINDAEKIAKEAKRGTDELKKQTGQLNDKK